MAKSSINISVSAEDLAYLEANPQRSPSKIFRRAMYMLRAGDLDIDTDVLIDPLSEIVKLRNVIGAQNVTIKEQQKMLKEASNENQTRTQDD